MTPTSGANTLNSSHKLHLLTSCQHADKLLGEIESILAAAQAKSPFPKYKQDITPLQAKIVQDYIARIRAQMVRVLASQGIEPPEPPFGSVHSIRVTLGFADIAFDECRPDKLRGYGAIPDAAIPELNGLVNELKGLVGKLDLVLAQGGIQDLAARLEKLNPSGEFSLAKTLERVIDAHSLIEFRAALTDIVERLESTRFEIAFFGRVSSGKSSLLNRIVRQDVLPVGVTPVTAVPTRIAYGKVERAIAWFAGRGGEEISVGQLIEFVTEQRNPANAKYVTRIVVELPSPRLRDGVVYVDTPGLGSLATAGAAETLAYLPRCDLGVVLIDAGSTLAADDLATIRALHEAAIPAMILLSKSDLLGADDLARVRQYIASHLISELGLDLPVHLVSARPDHAEQLEDWFTNQILPLYERHVELSRASLNRKIAALRAGVRAALEAKLRRPLSSAKGQVLPEFLMRDTRFQELESELRRTTGRFAEVRTQGLRITDGMRESGGLAIQRAAAAVREAGNYQVAAAAIESFADEEGRPVVAMLQDLARDSANALMKTAAELSPEHSPESHELAGVINGMPRFDIGPIELDVRLGRWASARRIERELESELGARTKTAFSNHGKQLESWLLQTLAGLQTHFDAYADSYRAQLEQLTSQKPVSQEEEAAIRRDIQEIDC